MKLLQVPTAHLEERIKEELEENPALETAEDGHEDNFDDVKEDFDNTEDDFESEGSEDEYGNIDISEYVSDGDDDVGDYKLRDDNYPDQEETKTIPHRVETSFHEILLDQLTMLDLDDRQQKIAEQIVGSIDDDGYLRRDINAIADDLAFRQNIDCTEKEIEELIHKLIGLFVRDAVNHEVLQNLLRRVAPGNFCARFEHDLGSVRLTRK